MTCDGETATSAIQASLTGHLVFSTLHTNDAPGAFTRLADMGVEPYLVASTVEGVLAQRLVRVLCRDCKQAYVPVLDDLPSDLVPLKPEKLWRAVGCRTCRDTGYTGRTGVYELLVTDANVRKLCAERASTGDIRQYALEHGIAKFPGAFALSSLDDGGRLLGIGYRHERALHVRARDLSADSRRWVQRERARIGVEWRRADSVRRDAEAA